MLFDQDASYYAEAVRQGQVKIEELVERAIANIRNYNRFNAVIHLQAESALDRAREMDLKLAKLSPGQLQELPAFYGLPILLKDLGEFQAGQPSRSGSGLVTGRPAAFTDWYVQAVLDAGFIVVGRTNACEFGVKTICDSKLYGPVVSPFDPGRNAGGSSGGAAVALKTGLVPLVTASDGGGSIRVPAAYNGVIGLKPSRGRMPIGPNKYRRLQACAVNFCLSKSVRDAWAYLLATQVEDRACPFSLPRLQARELKAPEKKLRLAYSYCLTDSSDLKLALDPEAKEALDQSLEFLRPYAESIDQALPKLDYQELVRDYYLLNSVEMAASMEAIQVGLGYPIKFDQVDPLTWLWWKVGLGVSGLEYTRILDRWDRHAYQFASFFNDYDYLITAVSLGPAPKLGQFALSTELCREIEGLEGLSSAEARALLYKAFAPMVDYSPGVQIANITGQPAISLPVAQTKTGLPLAIQAHGAKGREYDLLSLALLFEQNSRLKTDLYKPL